MNCISGFYVFGFLFFLSAMFSGGPAAAMEREEQEAEHIVCYYRAVEDPRVPEAIHRPDSGGAAAPKIAVIIDDMGMDLQHGYELIEMDAPLTFSFLPYAPEEELARMTQAARDHGNELMIHMPMEPENPALDLGGIALREGMDLSAMDEQLDKALASFDGYAGMNNHMGSRLTQDPAAMAHVMERLKREGLYFVDSKTISSSVAGTAARQAGLRTADRDVFLDHENSPEFVSEALALAEETARRKGYAVVIGHPREVTVEGLKAWIPTLREKGIELVYASALAYAGPDDLPENEPPVASVSNVPAVP